jgi:hypothetical protein
MTDRPNQDIILKWIAEVKGGKEMEYGSFWIWQITAINCKKVKKPYPPIRTGSYDQTAECPLH